MTIQYTAGMTKHKRNRSDNLHKHINITITIKATSDVRQ